MADNSSLTEKDVEVRLTEAKAQWEAEAKITTAKAVTEAVNEAVAETQVAAEAKQEQAVTEAVGKAADEAAKVTSDGIKEVLARCESAGISLAAARDMIDRDLSLEDAKDEVILNLVKQAKPLGDAGGSDMGEKKDPADKYRKEFKAGGGEAKMGCTEDEYVASCLSTDAGGFVG